MKPALWSLIAIFYFSFPQQKEPFDYGTKSSEALAHYQKGWEQILDQGEWTSAEASFRKAVELDSNFLLAWSQVGRISKSPEERSLIFKQLSDKKSQSNDLEKKLLEVYLSSLELIDSKDRGIPITRDRISEFYSLSERNFSDFLQVYPAEVHVYSEFIEVIHGIYGPQAALDTLAEGPSKGKQIPTFLISYTAQMQAELKDFEAAMETAENLKKSMDEPDLPIIPFTYAFIYFEMEHYEEAGKLLDQTLALDKNHTLAQRLKKRVEEKLRTESF